MSEELTKLKNFGAQKIYEDTHIPVLHVKAILEHNFDSLNRVQFLGFISILGREYVLDLSSLKSSGVAYFDDKDAQNLDESLFIAPKKNKISKTNSILLVFVVTIFSMYLLGAFSEKKVLEQPLDDVLIHKVQKTIKPVVILEDENSTIESNTTTLILEIAPELEEVVHSFKIYTKSKVWFGYIDVQTNKKKQTTFTGDINLDPQKKWLLIFGHGYIDMFINEEAVKIDSRDNIRYLYEDGTVKAISLQEFKKLNRGSKW
ncbi:hypothetical protein JHD46_04025 [Sulfurimonas sp. SAG-AH-194-C20]|nr:hypothetical protein [Sulfurimonas sp. SAG-AH-194-C20]MDF1878804.1 hypothetical protein [Sulfurimonas sp. SAG-AH-194-C20]